MKIGKAIKELKEGGVITRENWKPHTYLDLEVGKCPENSGKVEDYIKGISINLFNISTNIDTEIELPKIILVDVTEDLVCNYTFTIEDILAEDWYLITETI